MYSFLEQSILDPRAYELLISFAINLSDQNEYLFYDDLPGFKEKYFSTLIGYLLQLADLRKRKGKLQ